MPKWKVTGTITIDLDIEQVGGDGGGTLPPSPPPSEPPIVPPATGYPRMIDERLAKINCAVTQDERARYQITHAWLTIGGSKASAPSWAQELMTAAGAGGDHHCFGRVLDRNGNVVMDAVFTLGWPSGKDTRRPEPDGWANIPIYASYNPIMGPGPYWWQAADGEVLGGIGLPMGNHYSFWVIWRER